MAMNPSRKVFTQTVLPAAGRCAGRYIAAKHINISRRPLTWLSRTSEVANFKVARQMKSALLSTSTIASTPQPLDTAKAVPLATRIQDEADKANYERQYHWITVEAEELIAKAYNHHSSLPMKEGDDRSFSGGQAFPPALGVADLEALSKTFHYEPKTWSDSIAKVAVDIMEKIMHLFFREKYDHHAVTLETVAAVPGVVGSMFRHLRSLRRMKRDYGWINPLQEEAENERMHLLIFMQMTQPTKLERSFVMIAQGIYVTFYSVAYMCSPAVSHRMVGYLEEAAHRAYNDYLNAIDRGEIVNRPAGSIARKYYRLPNDATLRDVVLHVRADENMHRDFNHMLSDRIEANKMDRPPVFMDDDIRKFRLTNEVPGGVQEEMFDDDNDPNYPTDTKRM